jgi:hypothetical protein
MTVSVTTNKVLYTANGTQTVFPYTFKIFNDSDLTVYTRDASGNETLVTNYTVSGAGNDAGGNVTFTTAPNNGYTVVIVRELDVTQDTDYVENSPFQADSHENALDKLTMIDQQQDETITRSIRIPISDPDTISVELPSSVDRASKFLGFDADGNPISSQGSVGGYAVSNWGKTLIDDSNATVGRTTLGLGTTATKDYTVTVTSGTDIPTEGAVKTYADSLIDPAWATTSGSNAYTKQQYFTEHTFTTTSGVVAWDLDYQVARLNLTGDVTMSGISNAVAGGTYVLDVYQATVSGAFTVSWATDSYCWSGDAPTVNTADSTHSIYSFKSDGTKLYGAEHYNAA